MKLCEILRGVSFNVACGDLQVDINGLCDNSKMCVEGDLFFAIKGTIEDGACYISEAIKKGAKAIVVEQDYDSSMISKDVVVVNVASVRSVVGIMAKNFYCPNGYKFKIIGITGTNGKTTTTFIISDALIKVGYNVCVVGTSGIFVNGKCLRGEALTTPDPIDLQSLFGFLNSIDVGYVVMEVSAHALDLDKTCGIIFDYSIFSNLTEDHLDYFKTMKNYGEAKKKLFLEGKSKTSIINIADEFGKRIASNILSNIITYGEINSDYKIHKISNNSFVLKHNNKSIKIKLNISGLYNFYNATASLIVLLNENLKLSFIKKYFKNLRIIEGRYNKFKIKGHGEVILDFAHTPDGLEKLLTNVRENMQNNGKLISVFGCGGNRDRAKRSVMGEISAKLADYTIISIDNPRYEEAESVMADIESGVKKISENYEIVMPRTLAIKKAVELSEDGDCVVISGKGTEPYYEVNGKKEFYREDVVIECIKKTIERG